jgi:hypothetical protein
MGCVFVIMAVLAMASPVGAIEYNITLFDEEPGIYTTVMSSDSSTNILGHSVINDTRFSQSFDGLNYYSAGFSITDGTNELLYVETPWLVGEEYAAGPYYQINNADQVAGTIPYAVALSDRYPVGSPCLSFFWSEGIFTEIALNNIGDPHVNDVNDDGIVVGSARNVGKDSMQAFVWDEGESKLLLGSLFGLDSSIGSVADGINDEGLIVGRYFEPQVYPESGYSTHYFLAAPCSVPEPHILLLLGAGLVALAGTGRRLLFIG